MSESNEMLLIRALVDALGFDVETELDYRHQKEPPNATKQFSAFYTQNERVLVSEGDNSMQAALLRDSEGFYTSRLIKPVVSYKLIKRGEE